MVTIANRFKLGFTKPGKERPVLDLVGNSAEAIADIVMKDDLFSAVLVFSSALNY